MFCSNNSFLFLLLMHPMIYALGILNMFKMIFLTSLALMNYRSLIVIPLGVYQETRRTKLSPSHRGSRAQIINMPRPEGRTYYIRAKRLLPECLRLFEALQNVKHSFLCNYDRLNWDHVEFSCIRIEMRLAWQVERFFVSKYGFLNNTYSLL